MSFRNDNRIVFMLVACIGFLIIVVAMLVSDGLYSDLLLPIGGAIFGVGLSLFVGEGHNIRVRDDVRDSIRSSLNVGVVSHEEDIGRFRGRWNHYFVTKVGGEFKWRHRLFDFVSSKSVGRLTTHIAAKDVNGKGHDFTIEVGFREGRLFLFSLSDEKLEPMSLEMFPSLESPQKLLHCGIGLERTWDGKHIFYKSILTQQDLVSLEGSDRKEKWATVDIPKHLAAALDQIWYENLEDVSLIPTSAEVINSVE